MKVTAKEEAGLLVMAYISRMATAHPVSLKDIAEESDLSLAYLEKVVPSLRKAGLIHSERGVNGGYSLAKPAGEISVADTLEALSGDILSTQCVGHSLDNPCPKMAKCPVHSVWDQLYDRVEEVLQEISLADLG